jgi:hypothetical protein
MPPAPPFADNKDCICTQEAAPVCGTDNRSYSNRCYAACAGVEVAYVGACGNAVRPAEEPPVPPPSLGNGTQPVGCTSEAKVCPDGSAVGRTGPNCEFAACPNETTMTRELCESGGGNWNACGSACRGAPAGTACTEQCVQQCECGGIAGFGCPQGHYCTDYLPKYAADAMGVCRKA